jgi:hypothetical protein
MFRAFVVQINADCELESEFTGRVEHVRSGESVRFASQAEFLAFVVHAIRSERDEQAFASQRGPGKTTS